MARVRRFGEADTANATPVMSEQQLSEAELHAGDHPGG
jgi:hypothetical protein